MKAFLMFLVFLGVARHVYGDCPRPTGSENMELITEVQFPAPEGTSVTFKCQRGYRRVGSGTITCSNRYWSDLQLICGRNNCGYLVDVDHGKVMYDEGTQFGATAYVLCDEGYTVVGSGNKLSCSTRGWLGRLVTCDVSTCDPPNQIANGYFSPKKVDYQFSEVVTYSCNGQYKINGSAQLQCTADGQFDKVPPTCVLVECPRPQIEHGTVHSNWPNSLSTSATFQCNDGYDMVGFDSVTCDINSKWSPAPPTCNPIECKAPEIKNGVMDDRLMYKFSETVMPKCSEGYKLTEDSMLTCGKTGQWSPILPECTSNNTLLILLVVLGVTCGIAGIGAGVYFGLVKKAKGTFGVNKNDPVLPF